MGLRRWRFLLIAFGLAVLWTASSDVAGVAATGSTVLISVSSSGTLSNAQNTAPAAISPDGGFVMFGSAGSNLAPGDVNGTGDVFVRDVQAGTTQAVSVSSSGTYGNQESDGGDISVGGRYVAFQSEATNLVTPDANGQIDDVFVRDRVGGTTELISISTSSVQGNDMSVLPRISADGRFVEFLSYASNLVPGDTNGKQDIFVRDRVAGTTTRVDVSSTGAQANGDAGIAAISADGRYVAFDSYASNLVSGDTNGLGDEFVHDLVTGTTERVNVSSAEVQANGDSVSDGSSISGDGRYVAYGSEASNLVASDTNGTWDVFVRDRVAGTTERVSLAWDGGQIDSYVTYFGSISQDGRYVAFDAVGDGIVPDDFNNHLDVFVRDRLQRTTERISVTDAGRDANGESGVAVPTAISGDGRFVLFGSDASNLVAETTTGTGDWFLRDRGAPAATAVCDNQSATIVGTPGPDILTGTRGVDVIAGLDGNDTIYGLDGNDLICSGAGNDIIYAGSGNDRVLASSGYDRVHGGYGLDHVHAGAGRDAVTGDAGDDVLWGNLGDDTLDGGSGNDQCDGDGGTDTTQGCEQVFGVP